MLSLDHATLKDLGVGLLKDRLAILAAVQTLKTAAAPSGAAADTKSKDGEVNPKNDLRSKEQVGNKLPSKAAAVVDATDEERKRPAATNPTSASKLKEAAAPREPTPVQSKDAKSGGVAVKIESQEPEAASNTPSGEPRAESTGSVSTASGPESGGSSPHGEKEAEEEKARGLRVYGDTLEDQVNVTYKTIRLTSGDKTSTAIQNALKKYKLRDEYCNYSLVARSADKSGKHDPALP